MSFTVRKKKGKKKSLIFKIGNHVLNDNRGSQHFTCCRHLVGLILHVPESDVTHKVLHHHATFSHAVT